MDRIIQVVEEVLPPGEKYTNQRAEPLARERDPARLFRYFCSIFDVSKFNYVFSWAAAKVDYSRSTARGQWYMKQVWANVAVQVKLYLDIDPETESQLRSGFWNEIVQWWDAMVQDPHYACVVQYHSSRGISPPSG
ncbi:uncharacterized protein N7515_004124 [Penicillium bovifimosum]|uniref:Uncharacterized protein n=1 Tax=Penicillium bovifimosum TaxID=126998 RepID=A0A9W9L6D8_9EURO|nr:uncharacterized protein N7515_004124 [Penicillium bovifimosum]KAJ5139276.1 hypothetical protein N7515_004124 [Penicillium bovifimosum]